MIEIQSVNMSRSLRRWSDIVITANKHADGSLGQIMVDVQVTPEQYKLIQTIEQTIKLEADTYTAGDDWDAGRIV